MACYNFSHRNRGAQAIDLWGIQEEEARGQQDMLIMSEPTAVVSVEENEENPVTMSRLVSDNSVIDKVDDECCVLIHGKLNNKSMIETVMQSIMCI